MAFNAISQVALTNGGSTTDGTSYATASFTPTVGRVVLGIFAQSRAGSNIPSAPSSVGGHDALFFGALGSVVSQTVVSTIAGIGLRVSIWLGIAVGVAADTLTFTMPETNSGCQWYICELVNVDTARGSNSVIDTASGSGQGEAAYDTADNQFGAPADAGTRYLSAFVQNGINSFTPASGWAEVLDRNLGAPSVALNVQSLFDVQTPNPGATPGDAPTGHDWAGVGLELAATVTPDVLRTQIVVPTNAAVQRASSW